MPVNTDGRMPSVRAFRASALHYAFGRLLNAALSLSIFVALARWLPAADYAAYVVAVALMEILLVAANLGMDWVTAIEIPKLAQRAPTGVLAGFIRRCVGVQALALVLVAVLLAAVAGVVAPLLGQPLLDGLLGWSAALLCVEGLSRVLRDQVLSSLLLQWASQAAQTLRNLAMLAALALLAVSGGLHVRQVVQAELAASAGSLLLGAALLLRELRRRARQDGPSVPSAPVVAPSLWSLRALAANAWIASLASLLWGGQMIVLIVSRTLGAEGAGLVGFGRNLAEQVRKLMPLEFLFNLVRTFLVTRHDTERDAQRLLARIALFVKANLLFVLPVLLCAVLYGAEIAGLASGGRYREAHWIVVGWLCWVVVWSHHRLAEALAHLLGRSAEIGRSSLALAAMPLAYLMLLPMGGLPALFVLLVLTELAYIAVVIGRSAGALGYPWRALALPKVIGGFLLAWLVALALHEGWPSLPALAGVLLAVMLFAVAMLGLRPLSAHERRWLVGDSA